MRSAGALAIAALVVALPATAAGPEVHLLPDPQAFSNFLDGTASDPRPLVVHFWATWCDTCRREMPTLPKVFAEAEKRGARVVLVSLDEAAKGVEPVRRFLDRAKVPGERYLLAAPDPQPILTRIGGAWDGALPATFVFHQGRRTHSFIGGMQDGKALWKALAAPP